MPTESLISVNQFCVCHQIEFSFINSLQEFGLIEIVADKEEEFIPADKVKELEKLVRLHYEMDINLEGIEAVLHLLERLNATSNEVTLLKNRLSLYETGNVPEDSL
jgi:hypothetical protein